MSTLLLGRCSVDCIDDAPWRMLPPSSGLDANWHVTNHADTCVAHCFGYAHNVSGGQALAMRIRAALNVTSHISLDQLLALEEAMLKEGLPNVRGFTSYQG